VHHTFLALIKHQHAFVEWSVSSVHVDDITRLEWLSDFSKEVSFDTCSLICN
jgi:hypothetical protein